MANPLKQSIRDARRTNRATKILFNRYLGSTDYPRGRVISLYRQARRAIRDAYRDGTVADKLAVIADLRADLYVVAGDVMSAAAELGELSAERQKNFYQNRGIIIGLAPGFYDPYPATEGWRSTIDGQLDAVGGMVVSGMDPSLIYGDGVRLGALQPAPINRDGTKWIVAAVTLAFLWWLFGRPDDDGNYVMPPDLDVRKQAIAWVDPVTTDCCLRVHGQIQDFNKPFRLTGTPRYADRMSSPPFHMWCRTALALYMEEFDIGLTEDMRREALAEMKRRS
jgi:hypothetical protein